MNFLTDNNHSPYQQRELKDYWESRYTNTRPIMTPDADAYHHVKDKWPTAGDEGLKLPWREYKVTKPSDEQKGEFLGRLTERHQEFERTIHRFDVPAQDKERLALTMKTEKAAYASWEAPDKNTTVEGRRADRAYREAFGSLVIHDREMGHPISNPKRDFRQDPVTQLEQSAWMRRDGRELSGTERSYEQISGLYDAQAFNPNLAHKKEAATGDWYRPGPNAAMEPSQVGEPLNGLEVLQQGKEQAAFVNNDGLGIEQAQGPALKELLRQRREAGAAEQEQKRGGRTL